MKLYEVIAEPDEDWLTMTGCDKGGKFDHVLAHAGLLPAPDAERAVRAWETIAAVLKKYEFTVEDLKGIAACLVAADEPTDAAVMDALADALVEAEGEE